MVINEINYLWTILNYWMLTNLFRRRSRSRFIPHDWFNCTLGGQDSIADLFSDFFCRQLRKFSCVALLFNLQSSHFHFLLLHVIGGWRPKYLPHSNASLNSISVSNCCRIDSRRKVTNGRRKRWWRGCIWNWRRINIYWITWRRKRNGMRTFDIFSFVHMR